VCISMCFVIVYVGDFTCAHAINCMNVYVWLIFHYFCFYYLCKLVCIRSVHSKCTCFIGLIVCCISFFPTMHIVQLLFSFCIIIIFIFLNVCFYIVIFVTFPSMHLPYSSHIFSLDIYYYIKRRLNGSCTWWFRL
jgi:hypothetical protein